jgi:hypothetical protein
MSTYDIGALFVAGLVREVLPVVVLFGGAWLAGVAVEWVGATIGGAVEFALGIGALAWLLAICVAAIVALRGWLSERRTYGRAPSWWDRMRHDHPDIFARQIEKPSDK